MLHTTEALRFFRVTCISSMPGSAFRAAMGQARRAASALFSRSGLEFRGSGIQKGFMRRGETDEFKQKEPTDVPDYPQRKAFGIRSRNCSEKSPDACGHGHGQRTPERYA